MLNNRYNAKLARGLADEKLAEFEQAWGFSYEIRQRLAKVLQDSLDQAILESESDDLPESGNYIAKIADLHGYRRGLRQAIKLIHNENDLKE